MVEPLVVSPSGVDAIALGDNAAFEHNGVLVQHDGIGAGEVGRSLAFVRDPRFVGTGFFAGEAPDGLTTVYGDPISADVFVYWRDPDDPMAQEILVGATKSAPDGTWRITGLNYNLQYVVRARASGRDDVTVVGVQPSRADVITYEGEFTNTEDFDGVAGEILITSGLPPFTATVIQPIPYGLLPVIDGRKLTIEGATAEVGMRNAQITVGDSAGNSAVIPVEIPLGMDAPSGIEGEYDADNNLLTIGWMINSYVEQSFNIYRSAATIDPDNLPAPIGTVAAGISEFVDDDVVLDAQYYYAVAAVRGDAVRVSASKKIRASSSTTFDTFMAELGPLAWWRLDDEVNGPVQDHSGNGLHGSLTEPARVTFRGPPLRMGHPGAMGFCVASAGLARVNAPSNTAISELMQPGKSATIAMYVHRTAFTNYNFILAFFTDAFRGYAKYRIYTQSFIFEARDKANQVVATGTNLLNETYFVVARKNVNNSKYDLFVNGVWFASAMPFTQPSLAGGGPLQFPGSASWNYYGMRGYMSDVALFERALTDDEIEQLYSLGAL